jgi:hypothetical protein
MQNADSSQHGEGEALVWGQLEDRQGCRRNLQIATGFGAFHDRGTHEQRRNEEADD